MPSKQILCPYILKMQHLFANFFQTLDYATRGDLNLS